jgi:probable phosphoglycerate mutase
MITKDVRLYLARHGLTEWNKKDVFRGRSDVELDQEGREQAQALGLTCTPLPLRGLYSSPLRRAAETAAAVARARRDGRPVQLREGLTDVNRGEWEGLSRDQARAKYPALYESWLQFPTHVRFPGGETLVDVERRARREIEDIAAKTRGASAIIVTHHVVIRVLLCSLLELDLSCFRRFEVQPASISEVRFEHDRWTLYRLNDLCHLGGEVPK